MALFGAVIREIGLIVIQVADALDPAGTAPSWTPLNRCPDRIPDALLVNR